MEQLDYNLLFRWFVGLNINDAVWDATAFSKNRERLLEGDVAESFFQGVLKQARERDLLEEKGGKGVSLICAIYFLEQRGLPG
jgi:transposase